MTGTPPHVFIYLGLVYCAILFGAGWPLANDKIPPNIWMGFRIRRTLTDRDAWYRANRASGRVLMALGLVFGLWALVGYALPSIANPVYFFSILMVGVVWSMVVGYRAIDDPSQPGAPDGPGAGKSDDRDPGLPVR